MGVSNPTSRRLSLLATGVSVVGSDLLKWASGTYAGASVRHMWSEAALALFGAFAGGVAAIATIDDKERYQGKQSRENHSPDISAFTIRGVCTRTSGQADPLGGTDAYLLESVRSGANDAFGISAGTISVDVEPSWFFKRITTSGTLRIQNPADSGLGMWDMDLSLLSDDWERITLQHPAITETNDYLTNGAGSSGLQFIGVTADLLDFYVFLPQIEEAAYPTAPITPSTTDAGDLLSIAAGNVGEVIRSGVWGCEVTPMFASADLASGEVHMLYWNDANDFLSIEGEAGSTATIKLSTGGGVLTITTVLWSRDQRLTLWVDLDSGGVQVAGATSGNASATGTTTAWPTGTLYILANSGGTETGDVFMSEPEAVAALGDALS